MARSAFSVSRSVALSLAALLVLTGAMFMVTTFQQDSEEWVLVEDQVFEEGGIYCRAGNLGTENDTPEYVFYFDEESAVYSYSLTGGTRSASLNSTFFCLIPVEDFDFSKNYKFVLSSQQSYYDFSFYTVADSVVTESQFNLKSVAVDDEGVYTGSVVLLDQLMTDFSFKTGCYISCLDSAASTTFDANEFTLQVYELQADNTGSIAAGVTGLVLIVMGVFAMPMHNILRRK